MEDKTRYGPVFTGSNANLTLRSFSNLNRICMESGLVIWMNYAQNQILNRHSLVISTEKWVQRHRKCVQYQGDYF